ncbi:glutamine-hydrolyzing carbamoyl-phosphate synthase small subunit [Mariprofundus ferrooxydans]|uniref:Carbamoyl phosphate synthase small chain n=1 Tax=Mariprofundus ferrooxydans PV-1 TaxID=314345 RepID=Q0EYC3_9PROT|nr:glutamine-hydrolyzing carbamoyl-phosphate synthase small subunit [Mariprofundus ferrooxydans]EAU54269.1 Carbamoyl-phosphate synthase, small subunit [Mariprofundus ferrooxydans PV-1]KON47812.1 carbamoyl phosphate synthase small subunit [Mariprofundus ferrooxydans]
MTEAILALADGRIFRGHAFGAVGHTVGEVCFNTSLTGYQEILTDPSYTDQIMTFTYPHIGNVGINADDMESADVAVRGCIVRAPARITSNYRSEGDLAEWLQQQGIVGLSGIDTRALVRHLRDHGAQNGVIASDGMSDADALAMARAWEGLEGRDLVGQVSCKQVSEWQQGSFHLDDVSYHEPRMNSHVVAFDFGCKRNIFHKLADRGMQVSIVPAGTTAAEVLAMNPDGIFLSNGPGDPSAVGYAVDTIRELIAGDIPVFGICMGHQLLSQALGLSTFKLKFGHRGGNHPVKDETTGKIEITSQNHGFAVSDDAVPAGVEITHRSLFDGTVEGLRVTGKSVFSVQYHPEASPGPHDSDYLFDRFAEMVNAARA